VLIEHYDLKVFTPPDRSGVERFSALADLDVDISGVLPYLNAILPGATYQHATHTLLARKGAYHLTLYARQIAIGNVEDYDQAVAAIDELINLINRTWERRAEITPVFEARPRPALMTVFRLLPRTNCQQCGEPTCYSFAIKLVAADKRLTDCPPLSEPVHADKLAALRDLIRDTAVTDQY
jgi:ArsR family metal-binding transcriptional regulator